MKSIILATLIILTTCCMAQAVEITFAWDAVTGASGYRLYKTTDTGTYELAGRVCDTTDTTCKVTSVPDGKNYYTAVAYDADKLESPNSNIVCAQVKSSWIPSVRSCSVGAPILKIKEASVTYAPVQ